MPAALLSHAGRSHSKESSAPHASTIPGNAISSVQVALVLPSALLTITVYLPSLVGMVEPPSMVGGSPESMKLELLAAAMLVL